MHVQDPFQLLTSTVVISICEPYSVHVFFFSALLQHSCFPGSHPQQATITPTSCTPWRTLGRPSWMITSLPSRCMASLGLTWPEGCHHGNSLLLFLMRLVLEVWASSHRWCFLSAVTGSGSTVGSRGCSMQSVCLWSSGLPFPDAQKQMTFTNLADLLFTSGLQPIRLLLNLSIGYSHPNLDLLSGCLLQLDHYSTLFAALLLTNQSVFESTTRWRWRVTAKCTLIKKLMVYVVHHWPFASVCKRDFWNSPDASNYPVASPWGNRCSHFGTHRLPPWSSAPFPY